MVAAGDLTAAQVCVALVQGNPPAALSASHRVNVAAGQSNCYDDGSGDVGKQGRHGVVLADADQRRRVEAGEVDDPPVAAHVARRVDTGAHREFGRAIHRHAAGHDQQVGLPGRGGEGDDSETDDVELRGEGGTHLDPATGEAELHAP